MVHHREDFYSLSAAQRAAIRYAHKVYNRLKESGNTDSDVFELDRADIDKEFLKELEYQDVPSPTREKNHLQSKALIEQYRPPEIVPTDAELSTNPVLQPIPEIVVTTNEETSGPIKSPVRSIAITSQQINRRPSKLDRKQSTMRSLKKKKFSTSMRLIPNESDSDLSVGPIEEVDPFEAEKQTACIQYVDSFVQAMQSADQSAFSTLQQSRSYRMQYNESQYQTIASNGALSYVDPYNKKLKILCDSNSSKSYHQSFSASKELLCPDDVFPKASECSPWKDKNKRVVKKVQLLSDTTDEAGKFQLASSDEDHNKEFHNKNLFPYVEKLNREAYRLAEKLDILTVMMLGLDSKTIDTTREKVKEKAKLKHKPAVKPNISVATSTTIATSTAPSPQQTPVPSTTPNGTVKKQFTFESISRTHSNDQPSPKGFNSQHIKSGDLQQSGDDSEDGLGIQIDKSPVRAYLRRFSQRFKGIIQGDIIYSDTDSEKDPAEEDSDVSEPRVLGLTVQDKKAEEHKILETILLSIDPKLSERIRKGLALREERLRLMRRQQYIRRRRRQEDLTEEDVKKLKEYFDSLPPNDHPFSSSSSEDEDVSLTSAGVDYKMEAIPVNVTFKRMRGNTIRKTTPTPLFVHLEHRSTNVTIDPSFYERLSSRQSNIGSSGSTTPFPSRPNTTRHSMLIGNVTFDGLGLPKDQSKANIWEQMTDTLSSMCDEVDDEAANFQHFQQHRQRRMGVTMFVNRTGGKLWGDNVGSTMIVSRKDDANETILEGSTISTNAGKTDSYSDASRSAATSSVILLQISHFAAEYCYELFAVAISSVTDRIISGELKDVVKPPDPRNGKSRSSFRATSSRSSIRSPIMPIPEIRRSTMIERFTRKTKVNLVDEFNKIFDEPLRPESQLSKQRLLQTSIAGSKKIRFDDEFEENEILLENDDEQIFKNFSQEICDENDSTNIFGNIEFQDLLEGIKSNQIQKIDPLRSTMPTTAGSAKRPYSCGILASNEITRERLDSVQKYLNILKPKSSHASRMEYDEQTRSQWKQKNNKMPNIPLNASSQQKSSQVPSATLKFGVKGIKAFTETSSPSKEGMDRKNQKFREAVPESDEEIGFREASTSVGGWSGDIADPEILQDNNALMHIHGDSHSSWSLEGDAIHLHHNQSDPTIKEDNKVKSSSIVHVESLEDSQSSTDGDLKLSNLLAIQPPTDSVISYPSVSQLNKKVQVIFQDDIDDHGDPHGPCEGSSSSLALPYPTAAKVECDDIAAHYDGGRILNVKSISIDRQEDESAKSDKYIASSMISSIYNSQSYYEQASRQIEIVRSPSPPNKKINISTFGHPPSLSIKPSAFSPNQRKRMVKASPMSAVEAKSTISNASKTNNDMEGILKTSRPITTSTRLRQSDYMK